MAFVDSVFGEAGFLELSVDVAREHECTTRHAVRPPAQNREALVRDGLTIKLQTVSIKTPRELRTFRKSRKVGHILEREAMVLKRWIGTPETCAATKVRKARVDAHSCASGDEKPVCC